MCVTFKPLYASSRNLYQCRRTCQWACLQIFNAILQTVFEILRRIFILGTCFLQRKSEFRKWIGCNFWTVRAIYLKFGNHIRKTFLYVSTKFHCDTTFPCRRTTFRSEFICVFHALKRSLANNFRTIGPIGLKFCTDIGQSYNSACKKFQPSRPAHCEATCDLSCVSELSMCILASSQTKTKGHAGPNTMDYSRKSLFLATF